MITVDVGDLVCCSHSSGVYKVTKVQKLPMPYAPSGSKLETFVYAKKVFCKNGKPIGNSYDFEFRLVDILSAKETIQGIIKETKKRFKKELDALTALYDSLP